MGPPSVLDNTQGHNSRGGGGGGGEGASKGLRCTFKAHDLLPDIGQAGLPRTLDHHAADDVMGHQGFYTCPAHHGQQLLIVQIRHLCHNMTLCQQE